MRTCLLGFISLLVFGLAGCTFTPISATILVPNTSRLPTTPRLTTTRAVSPVPTTSIGAPRPISTATTVLPSHLTVPVLSRDESRLQNVLTRFGTPSQVRFSGYGSTSHSDHFGVYKLQVEYESQQFAIEYAGATIKDSTGYLACPMFGQAINLDAQSHVGLSKLETMSVQEFYQEFMPASHPICIRVVDSETAVFPPTFSPIAYYAENDAGLVARLTTRADCELPCWWGITPGVTDWQEAQRLWLSYGKAIDDFAWASVRTGHQVGAFGRHDPLPFDYIVRPTFYEEDGAVKYIRVTGEVLEASPSRHFVEDWQQYSLSQILMRLGQPSDVLLNYYQHGCPDTFDLGVIYAERGVLVEYSGTVNRKTGKVTICPRQEATTRINLCLVSPVSDISLKQEFKNGCWFFRGATSLEEATGISIEEFYKVYTDPNAQACMEAVDELGSMCP